MPKESQYINLLTKQWRAITYDYPTLASYSDVSRLYCLTDFEVAWLRSNLDYYGWITRWVDNNATPRELSQQRAELEYKLMTCIDLQIYQIEYGYKREKQKQLELFDDLYSIGGIPDLNANTPTDFFDGDGSNSRDSALCSAINIYIRSYASDWITIAQQTLGIVAIVGILASISLVGGVIATVLVGGLVLITQVALDAMTDNSALDAVVCCMLEELEGTAVNHANFISALDNCNFTVGTNEAIIRDIIASDLDQWDNYLSFLNSLGDSYILALAGVGDCPCIPSSICIDMTDLVLLYTYTGTKDSSFGNPLPSLKWSQQPSAPPYLYNWQISAEYNMLSEKTVNDVTWDLYNTVSGGAAPNGFLGMNVTYWDEDENLVAAYDYTGTHAVSTWHNKQKLLDVVGVQYVSIAAWRSSQTVITGSTWFDNFCINWT